MKYISVINVQISEHYINNITLNSMTETTSLSLYLSLSLSLFNLAILLFPLGSLLDYTFILFTSHSFSNNVHLNVLTEMPSYKLNA